MKVSIIIPVYNEETTLGKLLEKVIALGIDKEIIVVDDASTDSTSAILTKYPQIRPIFHITNQGKGAAVKTGISHATGDIIVIQDADLEYDPQDILTCIQPIINGEAKVVFGSRELSGTNKDHSNLLFYFGDLIVTFLCNLLYRSKLTDLMTCYKTYQADIIKNTKAKSNGFDWEVETTAQILKQGIKIKEVPIKYFPRQKNAGKKIKYRDGIKVIWMLIKTRV